MPGSACVAPTCAQSIQRGLGLEGAAGRRPGDDQVVATAHDRRFEARCRRYGTRNGEQTAIFAGRVMLSNSSSGNGIGEDGYFINIAGEIVPVVVENATAADVHVEGGSAVVASGR